MSLALAFELPPALEARQPIEALGLPRDAVRLLVSEAGQDRLGSFRDLPGALRAGDLLVWNDSATLPAALQARDTAGGTVLVHLSTWLDRPQGAHWVVEPRGRPGARDLVLELPEGSSIGVGGPYRGSHRLRVAELRLARPWLEYLERHGRPIAYPYLQGEWPLSCYQSVFSRRPGSAEMPSAGRPFTPELLARLAGQGVEMARLTLHTGVSSLESPEPPYPEWYEVPAATARAVNRARRRGGRVIAVGTTVTRALETVVGARGECLPGRGWTERLVTPDRPPQLVDGLLTGLHEPRASHLAMLTALVGPARVETAYRTALEARMRWHEFGDLHLLLP